MPGRLGPHSLVPSTSSQNKPWDNITAMVTTSAREHSSTARSPSGQAGAGAGLSGRGFGDGVWIKDGAKEQQCKDPVVAGE